MGWLTIASAVLIPLGSLLPWFQETWPLSINRNSFQLGANEHLSLYGQALLLVAGVELVIGIATLTDTAVPSPLQRSAIWTGVVAFLLTVGGGLSANSIIDQIHTASPAIITSLGYGVWVAGAGAVGAFVAGLLARRARNDELVGAGSATPQPTTGPPEPSLWRRKSRWAALAGIVVGVFVLLGIVGAVTEHQGSSSPQPPRPTMSTGSLAMPLAIKWPRMTSNSSLAWAASKKDAPDTTRILSTSNPRIGRRVVWLGTRLSTRNPVNRPGNPGGSFP